MKIRQVFLNEHEIEYITSMELIRKAHDQPAISINAKLRAALEDDSEPQDHAPPEVDVVYAAVESLPDGDIDAQMLAVARKAR